MKSIETGKQAILLMGIGNCGRNDDGLGWQFIDRVNSNGPDNIDLEYRYQLQVEDAQLISNFDIVLFADATHAELQHGFEIKPCLPESHYFFSSHAQSPETILYLADELYQKKPDAYTIAISGYNWGLGTGISKEALKNLDSAFDFFRREFLPSLQQVYANPACI